MSASDPSETLNRESLLHRAFAPIDIAGLVWFRIAFGSIMLWECWRYLSTDKIERFWIRPEFHFKYIGFEWVGVLPGDGLYYLWGLIALGSLGILLGYRYRLSAVVFFMAFTYVFLLDQARYLNHFYFVCLVAFLAIFLPANRCFSLDARLKPEIRSDTAPAWTLWILRAQIAIVYYFGALAKANADWLRGEPVRMWLAERTDYLVVGEFFGTELGVYTVAYGGLLFDLAVVPLLLWKRTRLFAFLVTVGFHAMNSWIFTIGIFPWLSIAMTSLFFDPSWPRRLVSRVTKREVAVPARSEPAGFDRRVAAGLVVYLALQILVPLRHFAYPGNVNWTEEGHRFSWHMMLRTKSADVGLVAVDPKSGQSWNIEPRRVLTERQFRKMQGRPDMIQQFCHYIAERKRAEGYPDIRVHAFVNASLNGRERVPLIDPDVDMAAEPRSLMAADWVLPLAEPLRRARNLAKLPE